MLEPDQYIVVFASGQDRRPESYRLTRDFHASADGTFVLDLADGLYDIRMTIGDGEKVRESGQVVYKAEKQACRAFPDPGRDGM